MVSVEWSGVFSRFSEFILLIIVVMAIAGLIIRSMLIHDQKSIDQRYHDAKCSDPGNEDGDKSSEVTVTKTVVRPLDSNVAYRNKITDGRLDHWYSKDDELLDQLAQNRLEVQEDPYGAPK